MPKLAPSPPLSHTHSRSLCHSRPCLLGRVPLSQWLPVLHWPRNSHIWSERSPWDKAHMGLPGSVQAANQSAIAEGRAWGMALCHIAACRQCPRDHQSRCRSASGCRKPERLCCPSRRLSHASSRFSSRSSGRPSARPSSRFWEHFPLPVRDGPGPGPDHGGLTLMCLSSSRAPNLFHAHAGLRVRSPCQTNCPFPWTSRCCGCSTD